MPVALGDAYRENEPHPFPINYEMQTKQRKG